MTDLLYQTDSYLREFDATVVAVDAENGRVALDRTAFYPGGGGQPHDLGALAFGGVDGAGDAGEEGGRPGLALAHRRLCLAEGAGA